MLSHAEIFSRDRIFWPVPNVLGIETRYKTKPEAADENAKLVAAVFAELKAKQPEGVRYLSLRLEDDTFIHFVETAADDGSSVLPKLAAFGVFQSGLRERCAEPPLPRAATIVGNYRMLGEA